jgi:hypothetical protein
VCADLRRTHCIRCDRHRAEVGSISWRGLCESCGKTRVSENLDGLASKRGPFAQWWAANLAASVGLGPLDRMPPKP